MRSQDSDRRAFRSLNAPFWIHFSDDEEMQTRTGDAETNPSDERVWFQHDLFHISRLQISDIKSSFFFFLDSLLLCVCVFACNKRGTCITPALCPVSESDGFFFFFFWFCVCVFRERGSGIRREFGLEAPREKRNAARSQRNHTFLFFFQLCHPLPPLCLCRLGFNRWWWWCRGSSLDVCEVEGGGGFWGKNGVWRGDE